jgi:long-chain-fatty-acid--CoA ligase ACSBG
MESEDRVVVMSSSGFSDLIQPEGGKNFHWTTDKNVELPIKIRATGVGSERPRTLPEAFYETTQAHTNYPALFVERNGKVLQWTWGEYFRDAMSFAKAMAKFNISERTGVSIMGFNAPEWAIAFQGTIMFNCISNGIYITNEPEACLY